MDADLYCRRFCFVHESGDRLYAYRVRNNDTGTLAFRVSDQRVIKDLEQEAEDEAEMMRLVLDLNYQVRMSTLPGTRKRQGGYRRHGRSIVRVERYS